jgi:hypothetical protein
LEGPSGPKRILARERGQFSSLKDFHSQIDVATLVGCFLRLVDRMGSFAAVKALTTGGAESIFGEEFSLA